MWIIELNVAGRQFTHQLPDPRRSGLPAFRLGRYVGHLRHPRAA